MQKQKNRLFWDGEQDSFSKEFKFKRVMEYGSFSDVVNYPYKELQDNLKKIRIDSLRTSESRKKFLEYLKPYLLVSDSWESAMKKYVHDCLNINQ